MNCTTLRNNILDKFKGILSLQTKASTKVFDFDQARYIIDQATEFGQNPYAISFYVSQLSQLNLPDSMQALFSDLEALEHACESEYEYQKELQKKMDQIETEFAYKAKHPTKPPVIQIKRAERATSDQIENLAVMKSQFEEHSRMPNHLLLQARNIFKKLADAWEAGSIEYSYYLKQLADMLNLANKPVA